ncbi:MAG: glycosyltransferase family 4 protein [Brevundimonas sp.]
MLVVTYEFQPFPGGIATYAARLTEAVRRAGVPVSVLAPRYDSPPSAADEKDVIRAFRHHRPRLIDTLHLLRRLARAPSGDIVLAADVRSLLLLWSTRWIHGRSFRVAIHGSEVSKLDGHPLVRWLAQRAYLSAELILANSKATLEIFEQNLAISAKAQVAHLGVDETWFVRPSGVFEDRTLREIAADAKVVCCVGRIEPRKGQLEVVRALASISPGLPSERIVLVLAGRVEDLAYARRITEEASGLKVELVMPGRICEADIRRLFLRSACHALFARTLDGKIEGFGLVLLEAAASGCPSVATRVGGIPEVMGSTGRVVDAEDLEEFGAALRDYICGTLHRDPDLQIQQARAFTWSTCAAATFPELFGRG